MNPRIAWLALLATASLSPAQQPAPAPAPAPRPMPPGQIQVNGIAATVQGTPIPMSRVNMLLGQTFMQLAAQFPRRGPEFERLVLKAREEILQELIDREIILFEFKALQAKGANLPQNVVDKEIDRRIRVVHNSNEASFEEELKRNRMTRDGYAKMVRDQLIVQAIRSEHIAEVAPPDKKEMAKEYADIKMLIRDTSKDKITFSKIFLPSSDPKNPLSNREAQLALAEKLTEDIKGGADFAALAKEHSRDAVAEVGGLQTELPRMDLAPEFAAIIFGGKDGDLIGPLEDQAGFTIVKIGHIIPGPTPPLSDPDVKKMVEDRITTRKSSVVYQKWIERKRRSAVIDKKI